MFPVPHDSPHHDFQNPYISYETNTNPPSPTGVSHSMANAAPAGGKRSRPGVSAEQSRRERVNRLLYEHMQEERQMKRSERRKRGVFLDSWIKCSALPESWDSEEDEYHRLGGMDEVGSLGTDANLENLNGYLAGDAGYRAKIMARGFKRIGRIMDGVGAPKASRRRQAEGKSRKSNARSKMPSHAQDGASAGGTSSQHRQLRPAPAPEEDTPAPKPKRAYKARAPKVASKDDRESSIPLGQGGESSSNFYVRGAAPSRAVSGSGRRGGRSKKSDHSVKEDGLLKSEQGVPVEQFLKGEEDAPRAEHTTRGKGKKREEQEVIAPRPSSQDTISLSGAGAGEYGPEGSQDAGRAAEKGGADWQNDPMDVDEEEPKHGKETRMREGSRSSAVEA